MTGGQRTGRATRPSPAMEPSTTSGTPLACASCPFPTGFRFNPAARPRCVQPRHRHAPEGRAPAGPWRGARRTPAARGPPRARAPARDVESTEGRERGTTSHGQTSHKHGGDGRAGAHAQLVRPRRQRQRRPGEALRVMFLFRSEQNLPRRHSRARLSVCSPRKVARWRALGVPPAGRCRRAAASRCPPPGGAPAGSGADSAPRAPRQSLQGASPAVRRGACLRPCLPPRAAASDAALAGWGAARGSAGAAGVAQGLAGGVARLEFEGRDL